ncbi:sulfur carrier protein ThiS [Amycolatopsis magusensis]|uniref:Sulfur carrier protein n=1 Tax=Amycolatopsis magusensis TaxID=882444 RepID=A0ABS4PI88_9PSEU|nr:sulfur carrier protein ThiS [Amycolatopsis magusensis]MBP2179106.1 sulfur carrier protein [Amycolatopsis magusensis]MDI5977628.1 sulfur carrier protein ThiS [Amycolatopsis magusensis]
MRIVVNGDERQFPDGTTVRELLEALGIGEKGVAVAVDADVIARRDWAGFVPADGSSLDILTAVQGG